MDAVIAFLNDNLTWVLIFFLIAAGIAFTVMTRGVQFRLFGTMWKVIFNSRAHVSGGISSFQAFAISLASRVGVGNIVGVAVALTLGGPGAIFWMWLMALLGMATAFVEATLAQVYKIPHEDGTFRGGPAYYIQRGLGSRAFGIVFACALIFTFGFAFEMIQAGTIASVFQSTWGIDPIWTAIGLGVLTALIVFGGIKSVARVSEILAPGMALAYVLLALVVIVTNLPAVPGIIGSIFAGAFGLNPALSGTAGGVLASMLNGVKRGMYSNEAGMGSAPNAAATATTSHPVHQGLIQSAGVFVDTMIVCTATAVVILLSSPEVYTPGVTSADAAATLTQQSLAGELGAWTAPVMAILIFVFAYSTILGNYSYAEVNQDFLGGGRIGNLLVRLLVVGSTAWGALQGLELLFAIADVFMSVMAVINLIALLLLGKKAVGALRDFQAQKDTPVMERVFDLTDNPHVSGIPGEVWTSDAGRRNEGVGVQP